MNRVQDKVALITGAAGGLGRAMARLLAREGADLVLTDIDDGAVTALGDEIGRKTGRRILALHHDVTDEAAWQTVIDRVETVFSRLDILINNAGIGDAGTIEETSTELWHRMHAIDLDSVFFGCKLALPLMQKSGPGSIINISSVAGIVAARNLAAYNSAKAAVRHLSKSVALHCAHTGSGIRCNSVHPAFVDTPILDGFARPGISRDEVIAKLGRQIPLGQVGSPEDVAYAVLYLASDESRFMTGAELVLDGGLSAM